MGWAGVCQHGVVAGGEFDVAGFEGDLGGEKKGVGIGLREGGGEHFASAGGLTAEPEAHGGDDGGMRGGAAGEAGLVGLDGEQGVDEVVVEEPEPMLELIVHGSTVQGSTEVEWREMGRAKRSDAAEARMGTTEPEVREGGLVREEGSGPKEKTGRRGRKIALGTKSEAVACAVGRSGDTGREGGCRAGGTGHRERAGAA